MPRSAATTAVATLVMSGAAVAGTIRVPEDIPTVLAAVDLAMPGDSVVIGPGTWTDRATRVIVAENGPHQFTACAFARGEVVIRGAGAGVTTLDVGGYAGTFVADVVFVQRPGEGPLLVEGMTLTGATGVGDAVVGLYSDGLEIRSCRLEGNRLAVEVGDCPLTMTDCEVIGNHWSGSGAIVLASLTPIHLTRCRFEGNTGICVQTNYDPGGGPAIFEDCQFIRNRGPGFGTALNLQYASGYMIERCLFLENVAEVDQEGGAVRVAAGYGEIRNSVFAYDSVYAPSSVGGGVVITGGTATVRNNTFVGCYATGNGVAFAAWLGATGTFDRNVVAHSAGGSAVRFVAGTAITAGCNLFWENPLGHYTSGFPFPTDVVSDPLFCDLPGRDFTVRDDSPCLAPPTPSCAPIGALGVGCGGVSLEPTSFGRIKSVFR
jgi:hypothetical protein